MKYKVLKTNESINMDLRNLLDNLSSKKLLKLVADEKIIAGVIFKDKNDRELLISPFGTVQLNYSESSLSSNLDECDGGIAETGLYSQYACLAMDENMKFDYLVECYVDLITTDEANQGFKIIEKTSVELDMAIKYGDVDEFEEELCKVGKFLFIPEFSI